MQEHERSAASGFLETASGCEWTPLCAGMEQPPVGADRFERMASSTWEPGDLGGGRHGCGKVALIGGQLVVADGDFGELDGVLVAEVNRSCHHIARPGNGELLGALAVLEL